jgi:nucleotide-binding universal stress UspA family protein
MGERALDEVREEAEAAGIESVEAVLGSGTPANAITTYVDDQDIDLVVVGTHGRTGLDRYLIESVAENVVRMSPVPVLTVPSGRED